MGVAGLRCGRTDLNEKAHGTTPEVIAARERAAQQGPEADADLAALDRRSLGLVRWADWDRDASHRDRQLGRRRGARGGRSRTELAARHRPVRTGSWIQEAAPVARRIPDAVRA